MTGDFFGWRRARWCTVSLTFCGGAILREEANLTHWDAILSSAIPYLDGKNQNKVMLDVRELSSFK